MIILHVLYGSESWSCTSREEVFENKELRRLYDLMRMRNDIREKFIILCN
jgi:hypothetical protein